MSDIVAHALMHQLGVGTGEPGWNPNAPVSPAAAALQEMGTNAPSSTDSTQAPQSTPSLGTGALDNIHRATLTAALPRLVPAGSQIPGVNLGTGNGRAVGAAMRYLGQPYQWGGLDCSGLVQNVYRSLGVNLPRTTYDQVRAGVGVPSLAQAQPGDLIFLHPSAAGPGHVGIYTGNGQMIDANHTGGSVGVRSISGYGPIVAIRRV